MNSTIISKFVLWSPFLAQVAGFGQAVNYGAGVLAAILMLAGMAVLGIAAYKVVAHHEMTMIATGIIGVIMMAAAAVIVNTVFHGAGGIAFTLAPANVN